MKNKFFHTAKTSILLIIMIFSVSCATREDFNRHFIERYVDNGVYTHDLKQFSVGWPDDTIWQFQNHPEFDISFDHIDGRSQLLVMGVNGLLRQSFPEGFERWILDRIRAELISNVANTDLSTENVQKFRIVSECKFQLKFGESFGVQRQLDMLLCKKDNHWVGVIGICPVEDYPDKKALFDGFFSSVTML